MSEELPDPSDLEIVQMMAAQRVVMNNRDQLHDQYIQQVKEYGEEYGVEIPDHYE